MWPMPENWCWTSGVAWRRMRRCSLRCRSDCGKRRLPDNEKESDATTRFRAGERGRLAAGAGNDVAPYRQRRLSEGKPLQTGSKPTSVDRNTGTAGWKIMPRDPESWFEVSRTRIQEDIDMATLKASQLLLKIARCEDVNDYLQSTMDGNHPCKEICSVQPPKDHCFQVPEPWRGDIENAPLLFVSSNPSLDFSDDSPTWDQPDPYIVDYYHRGFPSPGFPKIRLRNGQLSSRPVSFWARVNSIAKTLYGASKVTVTPGKDFAITELVHCKSQSQTGVAKALSHCSKGYMCNILDLSGAKVIVALGAHARDYFGCKFFGQCTQSNKGRLIISLPHPNARMKRSIRNPNYLQKAKSMLGP